MEREEGCTALDDEARRQRDQDRLERYRVMDDVFMRAVFRDNLPLAQRVLRVMTAIDGLVLVKEETQRDLKAVSGAHSVVLDVFCTDDEGAQYDMEIQAGDGLNPLRFRFYGSSMDLDFLKAGKKYSDLPRRWIVIVLEEDRDGPERATRAYSYAEESDGAPFGDGIRFLYVNASYRGDDELGSLMADFCESDPDKIRDGLLRERVQYLKRTKQGRREMRSISQEIFDEGATSKLLENVRSLMETAGWSAETAFEKLKVPEADRPRYLSMLKDVS